MKRNFFFATLAVLCLVPAVHLVLAAPSEHLNWGSQINHSACPSGKLVVNVTQKIINDNDSGVAGNAWAYDDIIRHIQVVKTAPNTFCATLSYQGNFSTIAGPSPNNTGTVGDGVVGTFQGGYRSTVFTGTFAPTAPTRGSLGTFNYNCDTNFNCPGYVDWTTLYFSSTSGFGLAWWGWVYHAGNNGSWVNSVDGNSGDITGN